MKVTTGRRIVNFRTLILEFARLLMHYSMVLGPGLIIWKFFTNTLAALLQYP
jgi:hypothetical protein